MVDNHNLKGQVGVQESKRGRVRRLLIDPLKDDGLRKSGRVRAGDHKQFLGALADALSYMADENLTLLRAMLQSKGQGQARDIWPSMVSITAFAELIEPRPVEDIPALRTWFQSVAGPRAARAGLLVETYDYIVRYKRPPFQDVHQLQISKMENQRRLAECARRAEAGRLTLDDEEWLAGYNKKMAWCEGLIANRART